MREALAGQTSGDGPIGRRVEARLAELLGASRVLLTTSGTHALELALLALGIGPGQEVICPSFTFVSSANAVLRVGARPVFADIEGRHAGPRPRGRRAAPDAPHRRAPPRALRRRRARTWRRSSTSPADAACAWSRTPRRAWAPRWRGRALGTLGDAGCLSFHETKNVTCGEGGALVVADPESRSRAEIAREKGTNRAAFFRGRGGQVHLGGGRLELRALGRARRDPRRPARQARRDPGAPGGGRRALPRGPRGTGRPSGGCACRRSCRSGGRTTTSSTSSTRRRRCATRRCARCAEQGILATFHYVPAALGAPRPELGADTSCPSPTASRRRCCACRCTRGSTADEVDRVIAAVRETGSRA